MLLIGEQVLEDGRPKDAIDSTEVIANLGADSTSLDSSDSKHDSKEKEKRANSKHSRRDKDRDKKSGKEKSDRFVFKCTFVLLHTFYFSNSLYIARIVKKKIAAIKTMIEGNDQEAKNVVHDTVTEKDQEVETG